MRRMKIVSLLVKDYDAAIDFYKKRLGFDLVEDIPFGDGRWITLSLPGDGCSLAFELAKSAEDLAPVGKQRGQLPVPRSGHRRLPRRFQGAQGARRHLPRRTRERTVGHRRPRRPVRQQALLHQEAL